MSRVQTTDKKLLVAKARIEGKKWVRMLIYL